MDPLIYKAYLRYLEDQEDVEELDSEDAEELDGDKYRIKGLDLFKADTYSLGLTFIYMYSDTSNEEF